MTKAQQKNIAASVRQRLLNKARETNRPFNELLQYFAMERFLYRLSISHHSDKFVLKSALMLTVCEAPLSRPTIDIDLLGRIDNNIEVIIRVKKMFAQEKLNLTALFLMWTVLLDSASQRMPIMKECV